MLSVKDNAFQRQLLQQRMEPRLTVFTQKMHKRRIERVLQSLIGRHRAPILTAVVLWREAREAHRDVGKHHLRQQGAFVEHSGKEERLQYAARGALRLHHVDHSGIGGLPVVSHVCDNLIVQIINDIHSGIVDIVHQVGLIVAVHDVHHRLLQTVVEVRGNLLAVMLFVLVAQIMIREHRHIERLVGDTLHHGQFAVLVGERGNVKPLRDEGSGMRQALQQLVAFLLQPPA